MNIKKQIRRFLSVNWVKSLRVNIYYFKLSKALRFPILMGYNVFIDSLGDHDSFDCPCEFGNICFGLKYDPFHMGYKNSYWNIEKGGRFCLTGTARFSKGTILNIFAGGHLSIGNGFTSNANLLLSCAKEISFGNDNLLGWDITIMDNDGGHTIISNVDGTLSNSHESVVFEDHVWVSAAASILKGTKISSGSIVGYKSNVCGLKTNEENVIIAGNPAKVVKAGFNWNH